jgi:hypothetical protein
MFYSQTEAKRFFVEKVVAQVGSRACRYRLPNARCIERERAESAKAELSLQMHFFAVSASIVIG